MFSLDWRIAIVSVLFSLICYMLSVKLNPKVRQLETEAQHMNDRSLNNISELMQGLTVVHMYQLKDRLLSRYREICDAVYKKRIRCCSIRAIVFSVIDIFSYCLQPLCLLVGVGAAVWFGTDISSIVFAASVAGLMGQAVLDFSSFNQNMQPALVAAGRIEEIFAQPEEKEHEMAVQKQDLDADCAIEATDLSFGYAEDQQVLSGRNIKIKNGEHVAIVGPSGCGKSTLIKLMLGMYEPQAGHICYYSMPADVWGLKNIRHLIAYIPQECRLFNGTIRENILFGMPGKTDEDMYQAARKAHIHEFILSLPEKYDTKVADAGSSLSGGQRQRICIARAFLKNAPVLIMDESTASLDAENEKSILQELTEAMREKTVLIVSHRASTINCMDRVIHLGGALTKNIC